MFIRALSMHYFLILLISAESLFPLSECFILLIVSLRSPSRKPSRPWLVEAYRPEQTSPIVIPHQLWHFVFFAWGHWLDICDITTTTPLKALNTLNRLYILLDLILRFFDTLTLFIKHEDLFWIKKNKNKHGNLTVRHKNVENVQNVDSEISNLKRAKRWVTIRWTFIRCQEICF